MYNGSIDGIESSIGASSIISQQSGGRYVFMKFSGLKYVKFRGTL
jgi:hypothetical protein